MWPGTVLQYICVDAFYVTLLKATVCKIFVEKSTYSSTTLQIDR